MEPFKLRRWDARFFSQDAKFFSCARPGRSKGASGSVQDDLVHKWVRRLPGNANTVIVSLLGRKNGPQGESEFSFYASFFGVWDRPGERRGKLSFQQWLDRYHKDRSIQVLEHPTYDFCRVPRATLNAVAADIARLLSAGRTVVLMDSGGETRTMQVCKHMGLIEDTRTA